MGPPLGFLPLHWNDRFSSSVQKPAYKSCHLYAGCRLDSKRAPSRLIPATLQPTGFDNIHPLFDTSSMVHSRSSLVCSPDMIFCHAFSLTLTTMTLYHSSLRWFGTYALTSIPRGLPSSFVQHELLSQFFLTHWSASGIAVQCSALLAVFIYNFVISKIPQPYTHPKLFCALASVSGTFSCKSPRSSTNEK